MLKNIFFYFAAVLSEMDFTIKITFFMLLRAPNLDPTFDIVRPIFRAILFVLRCLYILCYGSISVQVQPKSYNSKIIFIHDDYCAVINFITFSTLIIYMSILNTLWNIISVLPGFKLQR